MTPVICISVISGCEWGWLLVRGMIVVGSVGDACCVSGSHLMLL